MQGIFSKGLLRILRTTISLCGSHASASSTTLKKNWFESVYMLRLEYKTIMKYCS
jgi:hypothetical protein